MSLKRYRNFEVGFNFDGNRDFIEKNVILKLSSNYCIIYFIIKD